MSLDHPIDAFAAFLFRRRLRGACRFHALACGKAPLAVRSKHGLKLRLDPYEYVSSQVLAQGYYEEEVLEALREDLRPNDVFWDIGACLGLHALTVAKLHPAVRVWAFEPNPAMARLIRGAADENAIAVDVRPEALGARDGESDFYVEPLNAGRSGLPVWGHSPGAGKISVPIATGDRLVAAGSLPAPTVIKIDAEGSELDILRGMSAQLGGRDLRRVVFEDGPDDSAIKALVVGAGFCLRRLTRLPLATPEPRELRRRPLVRGPPDAHQSRRRLL